MSIEERFNAAVNVIRGLPKNGPYQPSNDMLLTFYSLFKQATKGKCSERRPAFWDVVSRAKWDAWNRLGEMPKEVAMQKYVDELKKIVETMSYTDNVANFMEYSMGDPDTVTNVSINDLEMVAPEVIQKARSRPNSPLTSRDTSPDRASPITVPAIHHQVQPMTNGYHHNGNGTTAMVKPAPLTNGYHHAYQNGNAHSDLSDDEYIDTVDDSETESTFRPVEVHHLSRSRLGQHAAAGGADQFPVGANAEVIAQLARTIERLNASVQQVNNRINVVEQSLSTLRSTCQQQQQKMVSSQHAAAVDKNQPPWWPFEGVSPRLLAFIILWPLVVNRVVVWLQRRK